MNKNLKSLVKDLITIARNAYTPENGQVGERAWEWGDVYIIYTTRYPRDWSRSSNGGDYQVTVKFALSEDGQVYREWNSSCELTNPAPPEAYDVMLSPEAFTRLVGLANDRAVKEITEALPSVTLEQIEKLFSLL